MQQPQCRQHLPEDAIELRVALDVFVRFRPLALVHPIEELIDDLAHQCFRGSVFGPGCFGHS